MSGLLCTLLQLYVIVLIGRVILSWFPLSPDSPMAGVYSFLYTLTEPILGPLRRVLPAMAGLDLSPLVVFFVIEFVLLRWVC